MKSFCRSWIAQMGLLRTQVASTSFEDLYKSFLDSTYLIYGQDGISKYQYRYRHHQIRCLSIGAVDIQRSMSRDVLSYVVTVSSLYSVKALRCSLINWSLDDEEINYLILIKRSICWAPIWEHSLVHWLESVKGVETFTLITSVPIPYIRKFRVYQVTSRIPRQGTAEVPLQYQHGSIDQRYKEP